MKLEQQGGSCFDHAVILIIIISVIGMLLAFHAGKSSSERANELDYLKEEMIDIQSNIIKVQSRAIDILNQ